jgi:type IV pilus assembly protein PilA
MLTRKRYCMRARNRQRGFTLIELLIVVTIILIIAAFTIPKITKAKIPANETSAVASIRAINEAEMIYSSSHPDVGFTPDLAMLGGTAQSGGEQTIDNNLASGRKTGYTFTYTPGEKVNNAIRSYTVTAVPDQVGTTGERRFFSDESGEVHYNAAGPADLNSPVLQ